MYGGKKRKITNTISANKQNPQQEMDDLPLFLLVLLALIFFRFHVVVIDWSSEIAYSVRTFFVVVFFHLYIIFFYVISWTTESTPSTITNWKQLYKTVREIVIKIHRLFWLNFVILFLRGDFKIGKPWFVQTCVSFITCNYFQSLNTQMVKIN